MFTFTTPLQRKERLFLLFYDICTRFNYINQHLWKFLPSLIAYKLLWKYQYMIWKHHACEASGNNKTLIQVWRTFNPSDPDVIFYTYPPRGGENSPPLVKWCFSIEKHLFLSYGEISQNFGINLRSNAKLRPKYKRFSKHLA